MREIIGVESWISIFDINESVKRKALFFDKIAIPHLNLFLNSFKSLKKDEPELYPLIDKRLSIDDCLRETEWLLDNGFLFETTHQFDNPRLNSNTDFKANSLRFSSLITSIQEIWKDGGIEAFDGLIEQFRQPDNKIVFNPKLREIFDEVVLFIETTNRLFAIQLRELENLEAYPILLSDIKVNEESEAKRSDIIQITLNSLPMPSETTSWEQIEDFRNDNDSKNKFLDLRNWMNEVARNKLSPLEIEQKLEFLVSQYQRQIKLHNLKTKTGTMEIFLISGAEVFENLAKFSFSKIAKSIFSIKHRKIELMENELNAKGSEIAYIIKAQDKFL